MLEYCSIAFGFGFDIKISALLCFVSIRNIWKWAVNKNGNKNDKKKAKQKRIFLHTNVKLAARNIMARLKKDNFWGKKSGFLMKIIDSLHVYVLHSKSPASDGLDITWDSSFFFEFRKREFTTLVFPYFYIIFSSSQLFRSEISISLNLGPFSISQILLPWIFSIDSLLFYFECAINGPYRHILCFDSRPSSMNPLNFQFSKWSGK